MGRVAKSAEVGQAAAQIRMEKKDSPLSDESSSVRAHSLRVLIATLPTRAKAFQKETQSKFDLVLIVSHSTFQVWQQVEEMLTITKQVCTNLQFTVLGPIGTRSKEEITGLARHGSVEWRVDPTLLLSASNLGLPPTVKILPDA